MPTARDHEPLVIEDFAGWWQRGDPESAPSDHFTQADNIQYFQSGFETRYGILPYVSSPTLTLKPKRMYNYTTQKGDTLLVLSEGGNIYHITGTRTIVGPILTIPAMEDFGFVAINGRAYISPFKTYVDEAGDKYQLGIQNEFIYVYKGDGTPARKAAGAAPVGTELVASLGNVTQGNKTDSGLHIIGVVYETDTGFFTAIGPALKADKLIFTGTHEIVVSNIPVSPNPWVRKRHLVSTKWIPEYNGDQNGYQYFFIPGGNIDNNIDQTKTITYFDADLLSDASHLADVFAEIPAGVALNTYHSRLVIVGEYGTTETLTGLPAGVTDNRSIARLSVAGEPEAVNKVDGIIVVPLDGHALTNVQEFRDIMYIFKKTRTYAYSDNYDEPVTWQEEILDQGIGAPVHGIATVLDTGGVNIDFLIIVDWSGLMLFNGVYAQPEMSWKIEDFWRGLDRNEFHQVQIVNDSINKKIWITLPFPHVNRLLHADYKNGMNAKEIRWARWIYDCTINTITLTDTDKLVIGASGPRPSLGVPAEVLNVT
jgi:hypothetical protein